MPASSDPPSARQITVSEPRPLGAAVANVAAALEQAPDDGRALRIEHALDSIDALAWLGAQREDVRLFWSDRRGDGHTAGVGLAWSWSGDELAAPRAWLPDGARLLVTARFRRAATPGPEWAPFGDTRCSLPLVEITRRDGRDVLACNVARGDDTPSTADARAVLERLRPPDAGDPPPPPVAVDRDTDLRHAWTEAVAAALDAIEAGRLEKVVLARSATHRFDAPTCPIAMLRQLAARSPNTFRYCVQVAPGHALVGASPELLFRRRGDALTSEALAGTRPRSGDEAEDERLAAELRGSAKENREHAFVRDHLLDHLGALGEVRAAAEPEVLRLHNLQHLRTPVTATLRAPHDDAEILARLHPTPAVCGFPTDAARAVIEELETFDRGLYGGVVGTLGRDDAECAVAIRCGLVRGNELRLFAGAGIVEGSTPEAEWTETENKMLAFAGALAEGTAR